MSSVDVFRISRRTLLLSACGAALVGCRDEAAPRYPAAAAEAVVKSIAQTSFPANVVVLSSDAGGDDDRDQRSKVQTAIDELTSAGGGTLVIDAGRWFVDGPLRLKSNVRLHLNEGARIVFSPNPDSYLPPVLTRWEGTELYTYSPMIFADGQSNMAITGAGTIDGQGRENWLPWRETQKPIKQMLRDMGRDGVPLEQRVFIGARRLRPHFIQFKDCQRVLIDGPTFVDSPFWMIHPLYCEDVIIRNIKCFSRHINSDGVDPDSSSRILIENCQFDVGDDGVSIKSGRDQDGWRVGQASEDIVIRNCVYRGDTGGAVAIGSEMSGGVRRVYVDGFELEQASHTLFFKANLDRGGVIEDIFVRGIRAGKVKSGIVFSNAYHSYRGGDAPPIFRRVIIEDVEISTALIGLSFQGDPRALVESVTVNDVSIQEADYPLMMSHTKNISLNRVTVGGRTLTPENAVPVNSMLVGH